MAYEVPIDTKKVDALMASLFGVEAAATKAADAVDGLNRRANETRTVDGRVVAAPASPQDAPKSPAVARTETYGPRDRAMPWSGGSRMALAREERALELVQGSGDGDLVRDQENRVLRARRRVEGDERALAPVEGDVRTQRGAGRVDSLDPYAYEGPRQRLRRFEAMTERARGQGDDDLFQDWHDRTEAARRQVKRLDRDPDQAKLDLLLTSRIGADGKVYPLVSRLLAAGGRLATPEGAEAAAGGIKALGAGSIVGGLDAAAIQSVAKIALPGILAAGGVALAGAAVYGLAEAGDARMRRSNDAFYQMGGSPGTVGAAMALGGEDAASKAMVLGDRLRQGSFGSAYLRSQGLMDYGPYTIDKSTNYVGALDALRRVPNVQERIRIARDTGLSDDLWTTDLNDSDYRRLRSSMGSAGSDEDRRTEAHYRATKAIAGGYWDRAYRAVAPEAMNSVSDPLGAAEGDGSALGRMARRAFNMIPGIGSLGPLLDAGQTYFDAKNQKGKGSKAPKDLGRGLKNGFGKDIDRLMADDPEAINGSLSGAMPAGWRGRTLSDILDNQQQMVGAFSV